MHSSARTFKENARRAVDDPQLRKALDHVKSGFIGKRAKAKAKLPEFEALRDQGRDIKDHTLAHLDLYLEHYEQKVLEAGGQVHWCPTADDARATILEICRQAGARSVTKGKSMIGEEIGINGHLEANGITPVETDLGEYIIQLRGETPSHIIAPAVHVTKDLVEADFRAQHKDLPADRPLSDPRQLLGEARQVLRQKFLAAEVGITGANFLVAETGSSIIVTNEGNGDLTQILPKVHIVIASLEKVVPTLEDATTILRVLARSATGQEFSTYTTFSTGPKRPEDPDGPEEYHVVLLDNGRSRMLGTEFQDALRCIRCGACMNHCPVYHAIGGHAGADRRGPDPQLHRRGGGPAPAQRLHFLRPLRGGLSHAHSPAQDDAPLAGAGVRAPTGAPGGARRPEDLGLLRPPAGALPFRGRPEDAGPGRPRPAQGPLHAPALRHRLDRSSGSPGAPGPDLSATLGQAVAGQAGPVMNARRP
jgi:L-lactate dehydrogenase complex protein LldF